MGKAATGQPEYYTRFVMVWVSAPPIGMAALLLQLACSPVASPNSRRSSMMAQNSVSQVFRKKMTSSAYSEALRVEQPLPSGLRTPVCVA